MKKPGVIIGALVIVIVLLAVTRTFVSNSISTSGIAMGKMEEELVYYKTQNLLLSEKFLKKASLTNVASEAAQLGFVQGKTNLVLSGKLPLAKR